MKTNPLKKLGDIGQSIWLDYIRCDLISSGELRRLIEEDGIRGLTSNPAIFEKAIAESKLYDKDIQEMALAKKNTKAIYETLSQRDVQNAADIFRALYKETNGADGYVSLEVNPHLAYDTKGTIEEARSLWTALNRPNVLIKVPATTEGLPAIQELISEGININVTLIFGLPRYRQVAEAFIIGLERRVNKMESITNIASVASFFLSRIDTFVDPLLVTENLNIEKANKVKGQVANSSAKVAYQTYKEIFGSTRFKKLINKGAHTQRLLWASTGNKNPAYNDLKYIEPLIGPETVSTVPLETINAYREHGNPKPRLEANLKQALMVLDILKDLGINIDIITQQLEDEGVKKFIEPFDKLIFSIKNKSLV